MLATLIFGLNQHSVYGRLSFPRLLVGLIVMALDLDQRDPARAREQARQVLEDDHNIGKLRDSLRQLIVALLGTSPVPVPTTDLNNLIALLLEGFIVRGVLGTRLNRRVLLGPGIDWYGHQNRGLSLAPLLAAGHPPTRGTRACQPACPLPSASACIWL